MPIRALRPRHIIVAKRRMIVDEWIAYGDGSIWFKAHVPYTRNKCVYGWI